MKISSKLIRRTFLLLSPFLLATTMGKCSFLNHLFFLLCLSQPPEYVDNSFGYWPDPAKFEWHVGDEGKMYVVRELCGWQFLDTVPGQPDLNDITFRADQNGNTIIVGDNGTIYRMSSPFEQGEFITNPAGSQNLYAIDQDLPLPNLVAVGDSGTVIKSTDNGFTWAVVNFPDFTNLQTCEIRGDYILVGGSSPFIYQSEDCGGTWEMIGVGENFSPDGPFSFNAIFFFDDNVGYIGGPFGLLGKTTDAGANWATLLIPDFEQINDLFFISPDSGVGVGTNGLVRFTADGGITWEEDTEVTKLIGGKNIKKIAVADEVSGRVIGDDGLNIIFTTDSSILTAISEDEIHIHNYSLSNNYPNPFNPSTIIEYSLPQYGFVTLIIYDMLGREIATLVNEEKPAGNYKFEFNASDLVSGVYYYHITVGNEFVETKKMVLLR